MRRVTALGLGAVLLAATLAACGGTPVGTSATAVSSSRSATAPGPSAASPTPASTPPTTPAVATTPPAASTTAPAPAVRPVVVVDPGHSPTITSTDPATGLDDSTYENEPEMTDVWAVSLLVQQRLQADGYTVVLTKSSLEDRVSLGQRAAVANRAGAALAISVHTQAGADGGIPFATGNNTVYTQGLGTYRETPDGRRVTFDDATLATTSTRFGELFQRERARVEGHPVQVRADTGYDQGTRGHAPGNIWMVQLLSTVPWIYNEAGGNSAGTVGLSAADRQRYADGLVAGVEACVPLG